MVNEGSLTHPWARLRRVVRPSRQPWLPPILDMKSDRRCDMRHNVVQPVLPQTAGKRRPLDGRYDPLPSRVHLRRGHRRGGRILRLRRHRKP